MKGPVACGAVVKIYTRKGDDGTTGLYYGGRVAEGLAGHRGERRRRRGPGRAWAWPGPRPSRARSSTTLLLDLERDLWVLMAEVATAPENRHKLVAGTSLVTDEMVSALEVRIDDAQRAFRDAQGVRRARTEPGLRRAGRGPDRGAQSRTGLHGGRARPVDRARRSGPTSTGCRTCCGRWRAGRRASTSCRARSGTPPVRPARPELARSRRPRNRRGSRRPRRRCGVSPDVAFPRSALLEVAWADGEDPTALADAAGVEVAVVGVPVLETPDGPAVAPGVPGTVAVSVGGHGLVHGTRPRPGPPAGVQGQGRPEPDAGG